MLLQVTFLLDGAAETRYLAAPPSAGESVHALGREWLVRDVVEDEGHYVVVCSALEGPRRARRGRGSGSLARGS